MQKYEIMNIQNTNIYVYHRDVNQYNYKTLQNISEQKNKSILNNSHGFLMSNELNQHQEYKERKNFSAN